MSKLKSGTLNCMHAGSWHVFGWLSMSFLFLLLIRALSRGKKKRIFIFPYIFFVLLLLLLLVLCHLAKLKMRYFMDAQKNAENKLSAHKNGADTTFISHINFFVAFKLEDMSCIKLTAPPNRDSSFSFLYLDLHQQWCMLTAVCISVNVCVCVWAFLFGYDQVFPWNWHVFYFILKLFKKENAFNPLERIGNNVHKNEVMRWQKENFKRIAFWMQSSI